MGGTDKAVYTGVVLGAVLIVVSLFTRYPLGAVKAIPFPVHSAGDYLGALAAIVAPFVLGFSDRDTGLTVFSIAVGVVVIALSLVTNYQDPRIDASEARSDRVVGRSARGETGSPVARPRTGPGAPRRAT